MKFLLMLFLFVHSAFALTQDTIISDMTRLINQSVKIAASKTIPTKERAQKIFELLDPVFDYTLMSRISLGQHWGLLSEKERYEFAKIFEMTLKNSYVSKLDLYDNQAIHIQEAKQIKQNRIWLYTYIKGEKENFDIIYKFYPNSKDNWLIYDVDVVGVSIIQTYRTQFADFLQNNSIANLKDKLKSNLQ